MAWTETDILWQSFRPDLVTPAERDVVKTAALIEANSADYVRYLRGIFSDNDAFLKAIDKWGRDEQRHGCCLGRWAEMADPDFDFARSLDFFRAGYQIPLNSDLSVRGSKVGELIARCVVESGTSSFYKALRDGARDPCLKQICDLIAQDEGNHYRLFRAIIAKYYAVEYERTPLSQRLKIALGRALEADDDEISFAYYSANCAFQNTPPRPYQRVTCADTYFRHINGIYRPRHLRQLVAMIFQATDLPPAGFRAKLCTALLWGVWRWKGYRLAV